MGILNNFKQLFSYITIIPFIIVSLFLFICPIMGFNGMYGFVNQHQNLPCGSVIKSTDNLNTNLFSQHTNSNTPLQNCYSFHSQTISQLFLVDFIKMFDLKSLILALSVVFLWFILFYKFTKYFQILFSKFKWRNFLQKYNFYITIIRYQKEHKFLNWLNSIYFLQYKNAL